MARQEVAGGGGSHDLIITEFVSPHDLYVRLRRRQREVSQLIGFQFAKFSSLMCLLDMERTVWAISTVFAFRC